MKTKYIFPVLLLVLPLLVSFAPDWVSFSSTESAFSAQFPGKPEKSEDQVKTDVGELALKIFAHETESGIAYMVMTTDYPVESGITSDAKDQLSAMFRSAVDGGVKNVNGTLLSEKDVSLKGYPGREYRIAYEHGTITGKLYLVKRRMYMVQVVTSKDTEAGAEIPRFLNSFRLL